MLCDVSDSVRNVSRLMLLFTHTLQSLFSRVRSFVFVSDLGEVTDLFRGLEPEKALDVAVTGKAVSLQSNSNYGRAFVTFVQRELPGITRRTTVLIIGDGRNNQNPAQVWALREIRRKARRVIWICPEDRRGWGFGDSEMDLYAQVCDQVVVVQSLSDLDRLADQLVPREGAAMSDSGHSAEATSAPCPSPASASTQAAAGAGCSATSARWPTGSHRAGMPRRWPAPTRRRSPRPGSPPRRWSDRWRCSGASPATARPPARLRAARGQCHRRGRGTPSGAGWQRSMRELRERDDPETVDRLLAHEPELLDLHRRTRDALGR